MATVRCRCCPLYLLVAGLTRVVHAVDPSPGAWVATGLHAACAIRAVIQMSEYQPVTCKRNLQELCVCSVNDHVSLKRVVHVTVQGAI